MTDPHRPLILVTNDDGIRSPGLHAAIAGLHDLGDLLIVAPSEQQSGMARSLPAGFDGTIHEIALHHDGLILPAYHLAGSPAQCTLYGVIELAERTPDLVVSGINYGENLGSNTLISGTVGAALQGGDMGIRSLAISLETDKDYHYNHGGDVDWSSASEWLGYFARSALAPQAWPSDVAALKIDLPDTSTAETPWRITRQSSQSYFVSRRAKQRRANGIHFLDYEVFIDRERLEPDSDIHAFAVDRVISVTPLSVNLSARVPLPQIDTLLRGATPRNAHS